MPQYIGHYRVVSGVGVGVYLEGEFGIPCTRYHGLPAWEVFSPLDKVRVVGQEEIKKVLSSCRHQHYLFPAQIINCP